MHLSGTVFPSIEHKPFALVAHSTRFERMPSTLAIFSLGGKYHIVIAATSIFILDQRTFEHSRLMLLASLGITQHRVVVCEEVGDGKPASLAT